MKKLLLLFLLSIFLVSCEQTSEPTDSPTTTINLAVLEEGYRDFEDMHLEPEEQLTQAYEVYYIYVYSRFCTACSGIKEEALSKIELLENDVVFFVEGLYATDLNEAIDLTYIPAIITIRNNQVQSVIDGGSNVLEVLDGLT